jgi:hypothetical protein
VPLAAEELLSKQRTITRVEARAPVRYLQDEAVGFAPTLQGYLRSFRGIFGGIVEN